MARANTTYRELQSPTDDEYQICGVAGQGDFFVRSAWQAKVGDVVKWYNPDTYKHEIGTLDWVSTSPMNVSVFPIIALTDLVSRAAGASTATTTIQPTKEKATMSFAPVKVETQLLINGNPAKSFSDDDVIGYIGMSKAEIKRLDDVGVTSTKIEARKADLQKGIDALVALLDART